MLSDTSRRAVLAGAGGLAAAGALSTATIAIPAAAIEPTALHREHHRLVALTMDETDRSDEEGSELLDRLCEVARQIWATPVRSWADVVARAEVAAYWADADGSWDLDQKGDWVFPEFPPDQHADLDERAPAELIVAVLTLAKGGANV